MSGVPGTDDPPTADDLRDLEARFEERFAVIAARFVEVDREITAVDLRLDALPVVSHKIDRLGRLIIVGAVGGPLLTVVLWIWMAALALAR